MPEPPVEAEGAAAPAEGGDAADADFVDAAAADVEAADVVDAVDAVGEPTPDPAATDLEENLPLTAIPTPLSVAATGDAPDGAAVEADALGGDAEEEPSQNGMPSTMRVEL